MGVRDSSDIAVLQAPWSNIQPELEPAAVSQRQLVLLAPSACLLRVRFERIVQNCFVRSRLLEEMQRLRGRLYVEEGAIEQWQLTPDGRHESPSDYAGWHLLVLDDKNRVQGGARYVHRPPDTSLENFDLKGSALASSLAWGDELHAAVEQDRIAAQRRGFHCAEVGGWALSKELRYTAEAIRTALGLFALSRLLGGTIGITTATIRNQSASILQRIGGTPMNVNNVPLPSYYDAQYNCVMSILRFDSSMPDPRYEAKIERIKQDLDRAVIMCSPQTALAQDLSRLAAGIQEYDGIRA